MLNSVTCPACNKKNPLNVVRCIKCNRRLLGDSEPKELQHQYDIDMLQNEGMGQPVRLSEEMIKAEDSFKKRASNFYIIGFLSIINSIIIVSGGNWSFSTGLGINQLITGFSIGIAQKIGSQSIIVIAFILNLITSGVFIMFGFFAKKQHQWAFIIGMTLYAIDGLIFLVFSNFIGFGIHVFILFALYFGLRSLRKYEESQPVVLT